MSSFLEQIKTQREILFLNISDELDTANLEYEYNNLNNSRYIFHYLHSLDKFSIDPIAYVYNETKTLGIPENYSYTRFELILGQYRHVMWHVGLSSAITFLADGHGTKYTELVKFSAP